jgi:glycosyltransferase involved in cell wall biosynthesis/SAM-dependent methyltransferase
LARSEGHAPARIGILAKNDPRHGIWRYAETILWALEQDPVRPCGRRPRAVSLFATPDYRTIERAPLRGRASLPKADCPSAVAPGTLFIDWLQHLDIMIVCEKLLPAVFSEATRRGVRVVYVPNLDWATFEGSTERWVAEVQRLGCDVWAQTAQVAATLRKAGVACELVPWSIPDPVRRDQNVRRAGGVTFLVNAGLGGWHNRRGVDIALRAFAVVRQKIADACLVVKTIKPLARYVPSNFVDVPGLEVIEGMVSRAALRALHERADAVLYPSRWEGLGLSLLEALHAGVPVMATDGWPMNEFVEHGHNGLLVPARRVGTVRLAPHWECAPEALADAMVRFATDRALRRRIACPDPSELASHQHRFVLRVRELLLCEPRPRVIVFRSRSTPAWRRSEEYWADALRMHGYQVEVAFFDTPWAMVRQLLDQPHDFVLASKAPPSLLASIRKLTTAPVVLWHHDRCNLLRDWLQSAVQWVDLACVPESGLEGQVSLNGTRVLTLLPGAKVDGDRGPGRRPLAGSEPDVGPDIVFLGKAQATGNRKAVLEALSRHFDVHVFGSGWQSSGLQVRSAIWGTRAAAVNRQAKTVLSVSNSATTPDYTSNRLFNSCGAGACVIAEAYPGLEVHYPAGAVASFESPSECVQVARRLLTDGAKRARMRDAAEDHTWRNHTWADRVSRLLDAVRDLRRAHETVARQDLVGLWNRRARRLGVRAVGHIRWNEERLERETQALWDRLSPHILDPRKAAGDTAVLDFGCGAGRFAGRLHGQGFHVAAVDISSEMLRLAGDLAGVTLAQIPPDGALPFARGAFDVLWMCLVLQHIPDPMLPAVVGELRRVLRPGGFVLLCENTHQAKGRQSKSKHVVFRPPEEYVDLFPGIAVVDRFAIESERHTVFAGRSPVLVTCSIHPNLTSESE